MALWVALSVLVSTIHVQESFEGFFPPPGWVVLDYGNPGYEWEQTNQKARSGQYSAAVFYGPQSVQQNEWLVTPLIDLTNEANCYLVFWEDEDYWQGYGDHHRIRVSTSSPTDTSTFVTVLDMTPGNHPIQGFDGDPVIVDLSAYTGQTIYVAFQYTGVWADNWYVDDIVIFSALNHDVLAEAVVSPELFAPQDTAITPWVRVANIGFSTESFYVHLKVYDAQGDLQYHDSTWVDQLAMMEEMELPLSPVTLGSNNPYTFVSYTALSTDEDPTNDTTETQVYAWSVTRTPFVEMITNTGCPPCGPADEQLDQIAESMGDSIAIIRYHAWWPSAADPFYQANIPENTARINYYGADYTPHLWINGTLFDADANTGQWNTWIHDALRVPSPWALWVEGVYDPGNQTGEVYVTVQAVDLIPYTDVRLRAAVIENDIYYAAPNGSVWHHQTFRDMFPDVNGIPLTLDPGESVTETLAFTIDPNWVWSNCEVVVFLQDDGTKHALNADRVALSDIVGVLESTSLHNWRASLRIPAMTTTDFSIQGTVPSSGTYRLSVYNVIGQRVGGIEKRFSGAGPFEIRMPVRAWTSGVYFITLERQGQVLVKRKFTVVR